MFDEQHLRQLRKDCEVHNIDFSRGRIVPDGDGYKVVLSAPLFELGNLMPTGFERVVHCSNARHAEGELLTGLRGLQRAERMKLRLGRVVGRDNAWICHTPLAQEEVDTYLAEQIHRRAVEKLQGELQDLLQRNKEAKARNDGAQALNARYGTGQVQKASPTKSSHRRTSDEGAAQ